MSLSDKAFTNFGEDIYRGYGETTAPAGHSYINRIHTKKPLLTLEDVREAVRELKAFPVPLHGKAIVQWDNEKLKAALIKAWLEKIDEIFGGKLI